MNSSIHDAKIAPKVPQIMNIFFTIYCVMAQENAKECILNQVYYGKGVAS